MSRLKNAALVAALVLFALPVSAQVDRTPDLPSTVPGSWVTDRYAPCGFAVANGIHGRNGVLQETVCPADGAGERPGAFSSSFYDTQGMQTPINGVGISPPPSQKVVLDLWVDAARATSAGGVFSTGMWTRVNQVATDAEATAWYPILNFSNSSGVGAFRYWDSLLGYQTLAVPVMYDAWNTFEINFTANVFTAIVNGSTQYVEVADPGTTRLTTVFIETYNNDGLLSATSEWSNQVAPIATPEPGTIVLTATGLLGIVGFIRRRRRVA